MPTPNEQQWVAGSCTRQPNGTVNVSYYPAETAAERRTRQKRDARKKRGNEPAAWKSLACGLFWIVVVIGCAALGWLPPAVVVIFALLAVVGFVDEFRGKRAERKMAEAAELERQAQLKRYDAVVDYLVIQKKDITRLQTELTYHKRQLREARQQASLWGLN
jgi:hypothetical protein